MIGPAAKRGSSILKDAGRRIRGQRACLSCFRQEALAFFIFVRSEYLRFPFPCLCVILNINELAISIRPHNFDITFIIFIFAAALIPKHSPFIQAFCSMAANITFCRGKPSVCRRIRCCPLSRGEKCRARVHTRGKDCGYLATQARKSAQYEKN